MLQYDRACLFSPPRRLDPVYYNIFGHPYLLLSALTVVHQVADGQSECGKPCDGHHSRQQVGADQKQEAGRKGPHSDEAR